MLPLPLLTVGLRAVRTAVERIAVVLPVPPVPTVLGFAYGTFYHRFRPARPYCSQLAGSSSSPAPIGRSLLCNRENTTHTGMQMSTPAIRDFLDQVVQVCLPAAMRDVRGRRAHPAVKTAAVTTGPELNRSSGDVRAVLAEECRRHPSGDPRDSAGSRGRQAPAIRESEGMGRSGPVDHTRGLGAHDHVR